MISHPRRRGFTLVELLVVILIIGLLAGLLIPAVLAARERARVTQCADNQKNVAHAIIQYELNQGAFPGFANRVPGYQNASGVGYEAGWPVMILKLIDREDVWNQFRESATTGNVPNARIALFLCPSDSDALAEGPALTYVANCGQPDAGTVTATLNGETEYLGTYDNGTGKSYPPDWAANGVLFRHYYAGTASVPTGFRFQVEKLTADDIKDGTRHTFLLSERRAADEWNCACPEEEQGMGFLWRQTIAATNPPANTECDTPAGINSDTRPAGVAESDLPSSYHARGVNVTYCDGHVKFLDDQVTYGVYALQMTPDGSKVWGAGFARGQYGSGAPGEPPAWCRQPLKE